MNSKALLICNICSNFLKDPVYLPCHCSICKHHLCLHIGKHSIKCNFCNEVFEIPPEGFRENKKAKYIIETDGHLTEEEKQAKQNVINSSLYLEKLFEQFKAKEAEFDSLHGSHFVDLKKSIAMRSSMLKAKIDEIVKDMLSKLAMSEERYNENKTANKFSNMTRDEFHYEIEKFRKPNLSVNKIEHLKVEQDKRIEELKIKLDELEHWKLGLENYKLTEFKCEKRILKQLFGFMKQFTSTSTTANNTTSVKTEVLCEPHTELTTKPESFPNISSVPKVKSLKPLSHNSKMNTPMKNGRGYIMNIMQKTELEALYKINKRPTTQLIDDLSAKINVSTVRVKNWLANKRSHEKRQKNCDQHAQHTVVDRKKSKTKEQLASLEEHFARVPHPTKDQIDILADEINLSHKSILDWFHLRRRNTHA